MKSSRRSFLAAAGAGPMAPLLAASKAAVNSKPVGAEIRRRADGYVGERYLVVDYYRIRRTLAFPLPVRDLSVRNLVVRGIGSDYPWATWMTWELEERVNALGYCAEWFKDKRAAALATRDLEALAAWPAYRQYDQPDLSSGHSGRLLWTAYTKWSWPAAGTREKIRTACARHAGDVLPFSRKHYGQVTTAQDILALPAPHSKLANIPLIGTIGAALTANVSGHPAGPELNRLVTAVYVAILDLRSKGYTEAVAYDGYVLDFLADWLGTLPAPDRARILDHPNFRQLLEQSYMLGAPGAPAEVAQLSDVEAREMPFHFSGQAKVAAMQPDPVRWWFLASWPLSWMRANALGAIAGLPDKPRMAEPPAGALDAHYAAVLRSGWQRDDVAVIASCHNSPTGHLQVDNGTLVIGHRGRWILSDPGYQQYAAGAERVFTIGPAAHNYPVINGINQTVKAARRPALDTLGPGVLRARLDLTDCYPATAAFKSVVRTVWLAQRNVVVVADNISAETVRSVSYWWHGHPDAAWFTRENWALLHLPDADLWFHSPQAAITDRNVEREEGSRGQLTAAVQVNPAAGVIWWVFALGNTPPAVQLSSDGDSLRVGDRTFRSAS